MNFGKRAKTIVFALLAVAVGVGVLTWVIPHIFRADFRRSLARQLNVNADFLHLNIPPAPNRLPGAAFVIRGPLLPLLPSLDRAHLIEGSTFEMEWRELGRTDAQSQITAGPWRGLFSAEDNDVFRIRLRDCRILEAAPDQIRRPLLESEDVRRQANAGFKPLVIIRSYEGRIELKVERGNKSNAELWAQKVQLAQSAGGSSFDGKVKLVTADTQQLVISWADPVVFAYEAAEARLYADHLGSTPNNVELTQLPASTKLVGLESGQGPTPVPTATDSKKND